jgi:anaerobic ribonucleoside-triphosphate reductase
MISPFDTTDITLFVRTSGEDIVRWNRQRIVEALIRETGVDVDTAETISRDVEKQIVASGISLLTTPLIRELVDAKLIERGLEHDRRMHALLGFPLYDVRQLILLQNRESANVPHGPEGTNLVLAEGIKREYALHDVFSREVGEAHIMGDIHIHALGHIDRVYSSCQSPEYIKKYGLNLPHSMTVAGPARHAEVLLAHLVRFGAMLQGHCAGTIGWQSVNYSFAPYLPGLSDREVRQFAQMLIYEFSQLTSARGGQSMFTDIHLHWDVPASLENVPAVGPGGELTGRTYGDYAMEARQFAVSLFEVFGEGDATKKPFIFPRPLVHLTERFFHTVGHEAFLDLLCRVAIEKGSPCFVFDRNANETPIPDPRRDSSEKAAGDRDEDAPWRKRQIAIQNVTLNLPRIGYKARGDDRRLFLLLSELMELAAQAHAQKRDFMEKLLSYGEQGPLSMLTTSGDGTPYLRMSRASYLVGMVGLNELVRIHRGREMHQSDDALTFGLRVIEHMKAEAARLSDAQGLMFVLEQTPAETTAYRFARLDLRYFSPEAGHYIRGDLARGEIYYTNSTHLSVSADVPAIGRAGMEGRFHPLIGANAVTHIWLGGQHPGPEELAGFITRVFHDTGNRQVILSPEFTSCTACRSTARGLHRNCLSCGSAEVEGIARITQYYSRIAGWNKGKLAELKDRNRRTSLSP